jgi:hypothetical protein
MAIKAYDATTDAELDSMLEESRRNPKTNAIEAKYLPESAQVMVLFDSGIEVRFPRARLEGLANATADQLSNIAIEGGVGLAWPDVGDEVAHYIPNLMDGFEVSCRAAVEMGRRGGAKKSPAKTAAVRANGKKGGRPKKTRDHIVSAAIVTPSQRPPATPRAPHLP